MKTKLLEIINYYGVNNQQRKLQEEVFELQEAIIKFENIDFKKIDNFKFMFVKEIIEELADVQVLLDQIRFYYGIEWKEKNKIMVKKIDRQIERIENERIT